MPGSGWRWGIQGQEGQILSLRQTYSIINMTSAGVIYKEFKHSHLNKTSKKRKILLLTIQILNKYNTEMAFIYSRPLGKVSRGKAPLTLLLAVNHFPDFKDCFNETQLEFWWCTGRKAVAFILGHLWIQWNRPQSHGAIPRTQICALRDCRALTMGLKFLAALEASISKH